MRSQTTSIGASIQVCWRESDKADPFCHPRFRVSCDIAYRSISLGRYGSARNDDRPLHQGGVKRAKVWIAARLSEVEAVLTAWLGRIRKESFALDVVGCRASVLPGDGGPGLHGELLRAKTEVEGDDVILLGGVRVAVRRGGAATGQAGDADDQRPQPGRGDPPELSHLTVNVVSCCTPVSVWSLFAR